MSNKTKTRAKTILACIAVDTGFASVASFIYSLFDDPKQHRSTVIVLTIVASIAVDALIIAYFYRKGLAIKLRRAWAYRVILWRQHTLINGSESVHEAFRTLLYGDNQRYAQHVVYVGTMDDARAQLLIDWFENEGIKRHARIDIYNTNGEFYRRGNAPALDKLMKLDSEEPKLNHFYCFHPQLFDVLFVANNFNQTHMMLCMGDPPWAICMDGVPYISTPPWITAVSPAISLRQHANEMVAASDDLVSVLQPTTRGWFHPIFPPLMNEQVCSAWRKAIVQWFDDTMTHVFAEESKVISSANQPLVPIIKITWRLTDESYEDAEACKRWLELLKNTDAKIDRYMFIDVGRYKQDMTYKDLVDFIREYYLPPLGKGSYRVHYFDSNHIPRQLCRDFAFIRFGSKSIVQDSQVDDLGDNRQKMLRVFLSATHKHWQGFEQEFRRLDEDPLRKETFEELITHF